MGSIVKIREVKGPNGNGWFSILDGNDVEYQTKKQDLADRAKSLIGQNAEIEFTLKENGKYTNRYLDKVQPAAAPPSGGGGPSKQDVGRMARFSAMNTAAIICAAVEGSNTTPQTLVATARWVLTYGFEGEAGLDLDPVPTPVQEAQTQIEVESDSIPF